ncbi:MAG: 3-deoxy-7-phosphoheptulonate synthase [Kiritimatiellae bacterium]|nr:3-deoxy-7-phosphoheptulonate synthase [Kiritimatiellia bacterium]MDD3440993.1 3-deoxy-7-phosphoheptulonate synthase [Kiritimatiellia bacterium]MDD4118439.1 3-deoxy-7-phosphoheptulonate synthase [Kiritimatiellia bacterium]NCC92519.1 3-deoxy-7-phosphoheptulonate synthase [Opitutae bacterium]
MIIVLKRNSSDTDVATVSDMVASLRYQPRVIRGTEQTVVACIGDELSHQSLEVLRNLPAVESVFPVQKKFKLVSREYHPNDSVVEVRGVKIGGGHMEIIAGPCAIESYDQFRTAVRDLTACGIRIVRAMPFKPRTSPYDFQGLKQDGLQIMRDIRKEFDVAMVSEVPGPDKIEPLLELTDMFQIGARNAQNYDLLEQIAKAGKPVLLKRGLASTVEEWLTAAEYLIVNNCPQVVLCERGLRSFDPSTRNLLDLGAVAVARQLSHLPILVDPSHAAGARRLVPALSRAGIAVGADGLIVEAHPDPINAFSDAPQQLETGKFQAFLDDLAPWIELARKERRRPEPA